MVIKNALRFKRHVLRSAEQKRRKRRKNGLRLESHIIRSGKEKIRK